MRPRMTCHMASSLDGRIVPQRWPPPGTYSHQAYNQIHDRLGGGSWIVDRVTGQHFAKRDNYFSTTDQACPRETCLPQRDARAHAVSADAYGKIAGGCADIGGDPIDVVLTEQVIDAHLSGLRSDGVGCMFAGTDLLAFQQAVASPGDELGIDRPLLEGGGHVNGAFLRPGLIDEISLMLVPAIDGTAGAPAVFDGPESEGEHPLALTGLTHEEQETLDRGIVWLRYRTNRKES